MEALKNSGMRTYVSSSFTVSTPSSTVAIESVVVREDERSRYRSQQETDSAALNQLQGAETAAVIEYLSQKIPKTIEHARNNAFHVLLVSAQSTNHKILQTIHTVSTWNTRVRRDWRGLLQTTTYGMNAQ